MAISSFFPAALKPEPGDGDVPEARLGVFRDDCSGGDVGGGFMFEPMPNRQDRGKVEGGAMHHILDRAFGDDDGWGRVIDRPCAMRVQRPGRNPETKRIALAAVQDVADNRHRSPPDIAEKLRWSVIAELQERRNLEARFYLALDNAQLARCGKLIHEMPHALSIGHVALFRHMVPLAGRFGQKMLDRGWLRSIVSSLSPHADC